jgi:hypothetical protein
LFQRDAKQHPASCWSPADINTDINTNIALPTAAPISKSRGSATGARDAL